MLKFRSRVMRARGLRAFAPCALRRRCGPVLSWARFQEDSIHLLLSSCLDFDFCARSGLLPNLLPRYHPSLKGHGLWGWAGPRWHRLQGRRARPSRAAKLPLHCGRALCPFSQRSRAGHLGRSTADALYRLPQRSRAGHLAPPLALVRRHLAAPPGLLILPLSRCAHVLAHSQSPPSANALTNPGPSEVFGLRCHNSSCHSRQRSRTEQPTRREITACRPSFPHT